MWIGECPEREGQVQSPSLLELDSDNMLKDLLKPNSVCEHARKEGYENIVQMHSD